MKIILKAKDGSIAVMTLVEGANKEEAVQKFKDAHPDEEFGDPFEFKGKLPSSREFRDAWTFNGTKICIDTPKAKGIHLERIREVRNQELDKLDKEQLRHLGDADKLAEIEKKKDCLRNLPSKITSLKWPEELPLL